MTIVQHMTLCNAYYNRSYNGIAQYHLIMEPMSVLGGNVSLESMVHVPMTPQPVLLSAAVKFRSRIQQKTKQKILWLRLGIKKNTVRAYVKIIV